MKIMDFWGRWFKTTEKPETRTISTASIKDRWSSYPSVNLTPSMLSSIFRAADAGDVYAQMELFEEMEEKDAHLAAVMQTRKLAVCGLDWLIEPYSEEKADVEIAEFIDDSLRAVAMDDAIFNSLDAIGKGFSAHEIIWGMQGSKVGLESLQWIPPKKITFWDSLEPKIIIEGNYKGIEPAPWKMIFHRHIARSGIESRAGMLRVVAWFYLFKNYAIKDWTSFNEVFGMPLRLGKYDPSATQSDKDNLVAAIKALGADAAGIISKNTEIEFVEAASKTAGSSIPYSVMAEFCNREMSKAILGQTLTTDTTGGTGTYAAGKVHNDVRRDLVVADAEALATTIREQLIRPLAGFNFGWDKPLPYFRFNLEEEEDLKSVAETYEILGRMGFPLTKEHVSDRFGVPLPESGQETIGAQAQTQVQDQAAEETDPEQKTENPEEDEEDMEAKSKIYLRNTPLDVTANDRPVIKAQKDLDALATAAVNASADIVTRMLLPVRRLIDEGGSLDQIRDELLAAYPEISTEEFGELVYQASMLAYMKGRERAD